MQNRKHKLSIAIVGICLIGLVGFKDTGIFVREYISVEEDESQIIFQREEEVNLIRETSRSYIVEKDKTLYEVPINVLLRKDRTTNKYKVMTHTTLLEEPGRNIIKFLNKDEIVQALKIDGDYGLFSTEDGTNGYIYLPQLEELTEDNNSFGISKVHKVLINDGKYYALVKGESVTIKDFNEGNYVIIDDKGNEFKASESLVELRRTADRVSRSSESRRSPDITKVIELAYNALGKPYSYAGTGAKGYDCSGLTYSIYLNGLDIKLNRSSRDQAKNGISVNKQDLIPGDLVFFRTSGKSIGHVGIYIGDGNMIHASSGKRKVMISSLDETYYKSRYVTARRIIN
ncbi:MAG: C40 family peptidase [Tissierellaceae bacterium]|nr:C40 family peptidase [Tissierellaceae bacterium]